jgi:hypothetical protein
MTDRAEVERQIDEILASETQAIALSDKLFSPDGLFSRLAETEDERRVVSQSPLFRRAQRRLTEIQRREASDFGQALPPAQATLPAGDFLLKLERAESA